MKPHTVILGAGATIAAIPKGDKNGKKSSVMNGLIEKLHLSDILDGIKLHTKSDNLEDIYSELYSRPECQYACNELEKRLYDYFDSLELPDEPTIYDFLILSLTEKDLIATFNWDPLLVQAYTRCHSITANLPNMLFLHGNVAVGYCTEHVRYGMKDARCPECNKLFPPTKLLYPIKNKDYNSDEFIKRCWETTEDFIQNSYMLTIFGYSAPSSDEEAVKLLKKAWGSLDNRKLEEVSVIDIIDENEMLTKWKDFIYTHHYRYRNSFFDSYLGIFPRRSCEAVFTMLMGNIFMDAERGFKPGMSWDDIRHFINELLQEEMDTPEGKNYPPHYIPKKTTI